MQNQHNNASIHSRSIKLTKYQTALHFGLHRYAIAGQRGHHASHTMTPKSNNDNSLNNLTWLKQGFITFIFWVNVVS